MNFKNSLFVIGALALLVLTVISFTASAAIAGVACKGLLLGAAVAMACTAVVILPTKPGCKRPIVKREWLISASIGLFAGAIALVANVFGLHWAAVGVLCATAPVALTESQLREWQSILGDIKGGWDRVKGLPESLQILQDQVNGLRKSVISRSLGYGTRPRGALSEDAARGLGAAVILHLERSGKFDNICPDPTKASLLLQEARSIAKVDRAQTATELPLPTFYTGELMELIAEFGVVRNAMTRYPLTGGISRPPRWGTRPSFGSIEMSALVPEKKPTFTFASLEPHKLGGVVIVPTELEEGSIVALGQYLARYGAVEFARAEDTWGFLADGTATYESIKGVAQIATENGKYIALTAGNTKPSDSTLADFRNLRSKVSTAALSKGAYYINHSFEGKMRNFNTVDSPNTFAYRPDGVATLDGFPIVWTEVLQAYSTEAAADTVLAAFGRLEFWWFGQRGAGPRVSTSEHVLFLYDQYATRFLEEVDFDYSDISAMAVLKTAAA